MSMPRAHPVPLPIGWGEGGLRPGEGFPASVSIRVHPWLIILHRISFCQGGRVAVASAHKIMARLIFKTALTAALLLLLVLMGMNNRQEVEFNLPPLINKTQKQPAAIMYFGFFAVGLLAGGLLLTGKRGGGGGKSKTE